MIDIFNRFNLPNEPTSRPTVSELRTLLSQLRQMFDGRGYETYEIVITSDLSCFSIEFDEFSILLGVSPEFRSPRHRWSGQVHVDDFGLFKQTRAKRRAELDRVKKKLPRIVGRSWRTRF